MTLSRLYFLLGVSVTCLSVALMAPKIVGEPIVHQRDVIQTDTLYVDKKMPNFQLETHQIKSSLNKSKLKHLLIYVHALCTEYNVDYNLVKAVISTESSWNHKALSKSDARGLMQVKPQTAFAEFKTPSADLFDPYVNVTLGVMYLSRLSNHYKMKTQEDLLTAYSHGPTAIKGYSETYIQENFYVASVLGKIN